MTDSTTIPIRIKGVGKSLCVMLDPDDPIDYLKDELSRKFDDIRQLAANSTILIDAGESDKSETFIREIEAFLKAGYGVASVEWLPEKRRDPAPEPPNDASPDREPNDDLMTMQHSTPNPEAGWAGHQSGVLMLTGRVRSGQRISADNHLLIMGDVNPGAEVMAGGDIIIVGTLMGTAIAGQPENETSIIFALDFRPTQLQIGSYVAAGMPSSPGNVSEYAHVEDGRIVVENYVKSNPFGRLPWPRVR